MRDAAPALAPTPTAWRLAPLDEPDWDSARTPHLALRTPAAEWCQSSVSFREGDGFTYHRADFAYEGLLALLGGENWKLVDRIGFQLRGPGGTATLRAGEVRATPEEVSYRFELEAGPGAFTATYALVQPDGPLAPCPAVLRVRYAWEEPPEGDWAIALKPIIDIRHMYYYSHPEGHEVSVRDDRVVEVANGRHLALALDGSGTLHPDRRAWDLVYRQGSGDRELAGGAVRFRREAFRGLAPGEFRAPFDRPVTLRLAGGLTAAEAREALREAERADEGWVDAARARWDRHLEATRGALPLAARTYVVGRKFGLEVPPGSGAPPLPEVGGWWFRALDHRNLYEGLLHNRRTLIAQGHGQVVDRALLLGLRAIDEQGRLPARVGESANGGPGAPSADATPLLFTLLGEHLADLQDPGVAAAGLDAFRKALAAFRGGDPTRRRGGPVLAPNGLLMTRPNAGWMNGRRKLQAEGLTVSDLPQRVDRHWQLEDLRRWQDAHTTRERYLLPTYFLPEVNAQWVRMLQVGRRLAADAGDPTLEAQAAEVASGATGTFKRLFWNPGTSYLYNLVTISGRSDPMLTAPAVEAAALLGTEVFTVEELGRLWRACRTHLVVPRDVTAPPGTAPARPFGLLAKDSDQRVFFGDEQYHEAVVWPREGAYLARLLALLAAHGDAEAAAALQGLLDHQLDHQMAEGVVFYANEILSLPEGTNPSPGHPTSGRPVPVKNPLQWVSLWCDAYLTS